MFLWDLKIFYTTNKCAAISLLDNEHSTYMNCYGATCNLVKVVEECTPEDYVLTSKHVG
jgi:hypothetical protein